VLDMKAYYISIYTSELVIATCVRPKSPSLVDIPLKEKLLTWHWWHS
jgi:hypothetical protein